MSRRSALALAVLRILVPIAISLIAIQLLDDAFLIFLTFVVAWSAAGLGVMTIARRGRPSRGDLIWSLYLVAAFLGLVLLGRAV